MGNGGPSMLPGSCEVGVDRLKSAERELNSVRCTNTAVPSFGGARRTFDTSRFKGKRVRVSAWLMASGIEDVTTPQYGTTAGEAGLWIVRGGHDRDFAADAVRPTDAADQYLSHPGDQRAVIGRCRPRRPGCRDRRPPR